MCTGAKTHLPKSLAEALQRWAHHMDSAKPQKVRLSRDQVPIYIFTDGSREDKGGRYPEAKVGGVIYDPVNGFIDVFGGNLLRQRSSRSSHREERRGK